MAQPLPHRPSPSTRTPTVPEEALSCLGALLQAPGLGLAFLDAALTFRFVNNTLMTQSGLTGSAYEGRSVGEVWPTLAAALLPLLGQALGGESVMGAHVSGTLGGVARHLRVSLLPANVGGMRSGVGLLVEDDTARASQELALRESEQRLRDLVAVSCDGYCLHDNGVVIEASPSLANLLGTTPEAMINQSLQRWIAPESRETVQRAMGRGVVAPYEATGLREDGRRLFLEVLARPAMYAGREVRMVSAWDISARKASEEAASRADTFREQLLGVVGHDLRSPLHAIQLSVGALERGGSLSEPQARQVTHVATATRRMERMIHELLDYTRARLAGGIPVRATPLSMDKLLERVVERFQVSHPTRRVVARQEGDLRGTWDESRLLQLMDNLVINALQHSPVDTPVEVGVTGGAEGVTLTVRNDGAPVPLEERATLFEPFKRGKRAHGDGLGLGLYIVRQIAAAHGGRVSVESGVGVGTRFVVWLPRDAPGT